MSSFPHMINKKQKHAGQTMNFVHFRSVITWVKQVKYWHSFYDEEWTSFATKKNSVKLVHYNQGKNVIAADQSGMIW